MLNGLYAYNSIYNLFNISRRDLRSTADSPARIATSMLFGDGLNKTYKQLIDYDAYQSHADSYSTFKTRLGSLEEDAQALSSENIEESVSRRAEYDSPAVEVFVKDEADISTYEIDVEQVAAQQLNQTESYAPDAISDLLETTNHIEIQTDNETTDLLIETAQDQSYDDLLSTVADSINQADLGIHADIIQTETDQVQLQVLSNESGEENQFSISGNLGEALGLNRVIRPAQDAVVRVNEAIITSTSNLVEINGGKIGIQINQETTIPFDLYIDVSGVGALTSAKRFANSFNEAMIYLQGVNSIQTDLIHKQLLQAATEHAEDFEAVGIEFTENDTLVIDEQMLTEKLESDRRDDQRAVHAFQQSVRRVATKASDALEAAGDVFKPATLPRGLKADNYSYSENLTPVSVNSLFNKGSIIDVFF